MSQVFCMEFVLCIYDSIVERLFLRFVSILSKSFFALVRSHLVAFSFFTAWHCSLVFKLLNIKLLNIFQVHCCKTIEVSNDHVRHECAFPQWA